MGGEFSAIILKCLISVAVLMCAVGRVDQYSHVGALWPPEKKKKKKKWTYIFIYHSICLCNHFDLSIHYFCYRITFLIKKSHDTFNILLDTFRYHVIKVNDHLIYELIWCQGSWMFGQFWWQKTICTKVLNASSTKGWMRGLL